MDNEDERGREGYLDDDMGTSIFKLVGCSDVVERIE